MAELDPEQEAALRRLRAAFGFVEVLRVIDHNDDQDQDNEPIEEGKQGPPAGGWRQGADGGLRRYTTRWRWFGWGRSSS
jgi:hypothetical protein